MRRGRGTLRRSLLPAGLVTLVVGGALYYIGSLAHSLPEAVLVVLLGGTVATLTLWVLARTGEEVDQAYWVSTPRQDAVPPSALDYRLVRLRRDLRDALERDDRADEIYPVIRELTAERLRARHDIDLDTQPELARTVLDPALRRYLDTPPTDTRRRSKSALHTAIEGVERL
ncbi:hypothetical protein ACI3EY_08750 [Ornithinimicrobium sp. LYQ92]|uniref:hypothetical protein n=1 Tax=Serinicoccus sp. LYQ92 TaxID=3378798 RepID=UPI0038547DCE